LEGSEEGRGMERRQEAAKREVRLSRMQTARASVSRGMAARERRVWTREKEGETRDAAEGMRLERWIAGPGMKSVGSRLVEMTGFHT